jgi:hypothetical protein
VVQHSSDPLADRRAERRFEIYGDLWATLVTGYPLPLINLGTGGVLVESGSPLVVGTIQRTRLRLGEHVADVSATVRHVRPVPGLTNRFLVGLAFVDLPPDVRRRITKLMESASNPAEGA